MIVLNACGRQPCQNGGECILLESGYRCNCPVNFKGINCETQGKNSKLLCKLVNYMVLLILCLQPTVIETLAAPKIILPPFNSSIPIHTALNLSCMARGVPSPEYTWFKDGALIPGETEAFFFLSVVQPCDRGSYRCKATNLVGEVTSEVAVVTIPGMC